MTAGLLLVALIALPPVAAVVVAGLGINSRFEPIVSTVAGAFTLLVAIGVAVLLMSYRSPSLQAHLVMSGWKLTPDETAPTVTLYLTRPWAFAPALAAACALSLISNNANRPWHLHLQHAAVQGSLVATTPELGLAMVTTSTIGVAMRMSAQPDDGRTHDRSTALRWAFADVFLWIWTAGFLGVGTTVSRIAAASLMVRASAFPFQGALARSVSESRDAGLLLVPIPAVIWAARWMEPNIIPNVLTWQLLTAAVVLIPALLAWASRNDDAAKAYRLTSLMLWPMVFSMPTVTAIGLIGLGTAAALCRPSSSWSSIASAASVVVPTFSVLATTQGGELSSAHLVGWTAVSLSAILMHSYAPRSSPLRESDGDEWRDAILVTLSLSTFLAPMLFGAAATVAP